MRQRLVYIDNLKGFLILLVVLGHCIQTTDADFDHNIAFRCIYSFHMPLFMFVSGFVSYKPQMVWETVRRRFVQLLVPFIMWALLDSCIQLDFTSLPQKILHPDTGLWFLWTLFFIVLALKMCDSVADKIKVRLEYVVMVMGIIMYGIMIVLKFKLFGFQFIAWYFPFYCFGYFGRKYFHLVERSLHRMQWPMLALFLVMAWFWMRKEPPTFMPDDSSVIYNYVYKFATAMVASATFLSLFKHIADRKVLIISKMGGDAGLIFYTSECYLDNNKTYRHIFL